MKVEDIINDKYNRAVNQFVITTERGIYFQSCDSMICKYHNGRVYLTPKWDYSATTRKHLYIFLHDYCHQHRLAKKDVLKSIESGEYIIVDESELELVMR